MIVKIMKQNEKEKVLFQYLTELETIRKNLINIVNKLTEQMKLMKNTLI